MLALRRGHESAVHEALALPIVHEGQATIAPSTPPTAAGGVALGLFLVHDVQTHGQSTRLCNKSPHMRMQTHRVQTLHTHELLSMRKAHGEMHFTDAPMAHSTRLVHKQVVARVVASD